MKQYLVIMVLAVILQSCVRKQSGTPKEFKSNTTVNKGIYQSDTSSIKEVLSKMLKENTHPFVPSKQFDKNTSLYIDTLIYSPNKLKMIVFVISKNSTDKLLVKDGGKDLFFNANYLFCLRDSINSAIKVYDYSGFNLVYYDDYNGIKDALRDYCFYRIAAENNEEEKKYNLDDLRFWKSDDFNQVIKYSKATKADN